jgi:hypothetical protein
MNIKISITSDFFNLTKRIFIALKQPRTYELCISCERENDLKFAFIYGV